MTKHNILLKLTSSIEFPFMFVVPFRRHSFDDFSANDTFHLLGNTLENKPDPFSHSPEVFYFIVMTLESKVVNIT